MWFFTYGLKCFSQSDCSILWWSISLEGIKWYHSFFCMELSLREGNIWDYHFWLGWIVVSLVQSDCRIIWSSISLEGINRAFRFFAWWKSSSEGIMWDYLFWLDVASCTIHPIRLQDLIINICGKNQVILFFFALCHQGKVAPETTTFWLAITCFVSNPIRSQNDQVLSFFYNSKLAFLR